MIDFVEQKQKTPVSFKLFETWVEKNYDTTLNIWNGTIKNEDVLLFLDERLIYLFVLTDEIQDRWRWWVWDKNNDEFYGDPNRIGRDNRTEATNQAIKKGFDLLEDKLKKN